MSKTRKNRPFFAFQIRKRGLSHLARLYGRQVQMPYGIMRVNFVPSTVAPARKPAWPKTMPTTGARAVTVEAFST